MANEKQYDSDGREYTPSVPSKPFKLGDLIPYSNTRPNEPSATESAEPDSGPTQ